MSHHATRTLQELGYRLTPQRTLVWDVLRMDGNHLDAEEICRRVQEQFPHVNISTVYRNLELLVELNLVRETRLGPNRRFYEVEEEVPHHHLVCEACGRVTHVHDDDLGDLPERLRTGWAFVVREMTVFGHCSECRPTHPAEATPDGPGRAGHAHP